MMRGNPTAQRLPLVSLMNKAKDASKSSKSSQKITENGKIKLNFSFNAN
jgi:hypothetical protein